MKDTPQQLQQKAQIALTARDNGDPRWLDLVVSLAFSTGVDPRVCERNIEAMAAGTYAE